MIPLYVEFLATGDELLDGSTVDTNSQRLATMLSPMGLKIERTTVLRDDRQTLVEETRAIRIRASQALHGIIFVSGGLGPTSDDLTLEAISQAFGAPLVFSRRAELNVLQRLNRLKRSHVNQSNLKQAWIPKGSTVLKNREGTAPGVIWEPVPDLTFIFLPGVPREFNHLLEDEVAPLLTRRYRKILRKTVGVHTLYLNVLGWPESVLNEFTKTLKIPKEIRLGFRTQFPINQIKLIVRARSLSEARKKASPLLRILRKKCGSSVFSQTQDPAFERSIFESLLKQKTTVSVAESCTGGMLASALTQTSGASKVFERGFVTYSNQSKIDLLGVSKKTLFDHGAVSEQTATEMATGALLRTRAKKTVAITGIAGPSGGSAKKPVGLIYIALAKRSAGRVKSHCVELRLGFDRFHNQKFAVTHALELLRDF